jgi:hypothetical protein
MPMNHSQRREIVDRVVRRHDDLLELLDALNLEIEQVLGGLTHDRENSSGVGLQPDLPNS